MDLSQRARAIPPSATLAIDARVAELRAEGLDLVGLGAGQPDFPTPPQAIEAATAFLRKGRVLYTPTAGLPELRAAAAEHVSRIVGVSYAPTQIAVTNGAKEALALAIAALVDRGGEILVPRPAWLSYGPMARAFDVGTRLLETDDATGFKLAPETLAAAITPASRLLVLNSPCNPTGAVYTREELLALCAVVREHDLLLLSDEIYWPYVYEGEFVSPASLPGMAERTVVVNGLSKSHAMTGWRVGFLAADAVLTKAVVSLKSHLTANTSAPAQHAALGALAAGEAYTRSMVEAFARRRRLALEALDRLDGVRLVPPTGAFYVFPRVDAFYGQGIRGSTEFCTALLEQARLAAVPGAAFDEDRCIRLSIAASEAQLAEGLERLSGFLAGLRAGVT